MKLDKDLSEEGIRKLGYVLGLSVEETSSGILSLVIANMAGAVREITTGQGQDPREFNLLSYGGATSMLVSFLASELGIKSVIVPREPGNFSVGGFSSWTSSMIFLKHMWKAFRRENWALTTGYSPT